MLVVCVLNADWRPCSGPIKIENGWFSSSTDLEQHLPGTVITYQCDAGYYMHCMDGDFNFQTSSRNQYAITCERNGEWNMEVPHCKGTF